MPWRAWGEPTAWPDWVHQGRRKVVHFLQAYFSRGGDGRGATGPDEPAPLHCVLAADLPAVHSTLMVSVEDAVGLFGLSRPSPTKRADYFVVSSGVQRNHKQYRALRAALHRVSDEHYYATGRVPTFWVRDFCADPADLERHRSSLPFFAGACSWPLVLAGDGFLAEPHSAFELFVMCATHPEPARMKFRTIGDRYMNLFAAELLADIRSFDVDAVLGSAHALHGLSLDPASTTVYGRVLARTKAAGDAIEGINEVVRGFGTVAALLQHQARRLQTGAYNFDQLSEVLLTAGLGGEGAEGIVRPVELVRSRVVYAPDNEIGKGEFGAVLKGSYNPLSDTKSEFDIAIKILHKFNAAEHPGEAGSAAQREELMREAIITAQFNHNNVLRLVGVCTVGEPLLLVLQFCELGSLKDRLKDISGHARPAAKAAAALEAWAAEVIPYCFGIADGMAYLNGRKFIHRDLATRNVLVTRGNVAKVADFGLSRDVSEGTYYRSADTGAKVPLRWCAPEVLSSRRFSAQSDVYAYGITLIEVFSLGATPFEVMSNAEVIERVKDGLIHPQPPRCPDEIYTNVVGRCLAHDPTDRPTFAEVRVWFADYEETTGIDVTRPDEDFGGDFLSGEIITSVIAERMDTADPDAGDTRCGRISPGNRRDVRDRRRAGTAPGDSPGGRLPAAHEVTRQMTMVQRDWGSFGKLEFTREEEEGIRMRRHSDDGLISLVRNAKLRMHLARRRRPHRELQRGGDGAAGSGWGRHLRPVQGREREREPDRSGAVRAVDADAVCPDRTVAVHGPVVPPPKSAGQCRCCCPPGVANFGRCRARADRPVFFHAEGTPGPPHRHSTSTPVGHSDSRNSAAAAAAAAAATSAGSEWHCCGRPAARPRHRPRRGQGRRSRCRRCLPSHATAPAGHAPSSTRATTAAAAAAVSVQSSASMSTQRSMAVSHWQGASRRCVRRIHPRRHRRCL